MIVHTLVVDDPNAGTSVSVYTSADQVNERLIQFAKDAGIPTDVPPDDVVQALRDSGYGVYFDEQQITIPSTDWHDDEDARGALSPRDRLAEALLDENGLRATNAALDVLEAVVASLDATDATWKHPKHPVPSVSNYAFNVRRTLGKFKAIR